MALTKEEKKEIMAAYAQDANDTGRTEVQIAQLSKLISKLTEHLKVNKKDYSCRRGLMMLVGQRRRLLNYFKKKAGREAYKELITKQGLRK